MVDVDSKTHDGKKTSFCIEAQNRKLGGLEVGKASENWLVCRSARLCNYKHIYFF